MDETAVNPTYTSLAEKLKLLIRRNNPKALVPDNLNKWVREVRLMIESDGRSIEDIHRVMEWSQNDSFWMSNILSMSKLRKQFDQLWMKMNARGGRIGLSIPTAASGFTTTKQSII